MDRRNFLKGSTLAAGAVVTANTGAEAQNASGAGATHKKPASFKLAYAPHEGHFKNSAGDDIVDQINFAADHGFTAWEDNYMANRPIDEQRRIAAALERHGMQMGVYIAGMREDFWRTREVLSGDDNGPRKDFLKLISAQTEVAKRVNAKWTTIVPGFADPKLPMGFQTAKIIELLRRACDIYEPHGLTMVLEPLNTRTNHPGVFLTTVAQAYAICTAVNRPECKILYDMYHEQVEAGNLINTIDAAWDQTAYFQVGDNPGRNEPTTGEINYKNIFAHLHAKGFKGVVGMEHGNSVDGVAGEEALITAYRAVDGF